MPRAQRIVEVGCSTGALAAAYRAQHPCCSYYGVELDPMYARHATAHCTKVIVGNIDLLAKDAQRNPWLQADGYVFGDCLEHLQDPWKLLATIKTFMPKDGWVCATFLTYITTEYRRS